MRSYTAGTVRIQHLAIAIGCAGLLLSGCGQVTVPMGSNDVDTPTIITGSITSSTDVAYSDISEEDRDLIASHLDEIETELAKGSVSPATSLPWLNALSGNSGTVTSIDTGIFGETGCVNFKTTANTIAGIKLYAGTACRDITQRFAVTSLTVSDA
ncbi:pyridoxamine 5'-phosphate oxidase [Rhodobacterales bacterium]|nr:pyridoxamine 5'-phosphate oxidase [Rhodobacterales bacterium]